jgi:hypothetical protein
MVSKTFGEGSLTWFVIMTLTIYMIKFIAFDKNHTGQRAALIIVSIMFFLYLMIWNIHLTSNELVCGEYGFTLGVQATIFPYVFIYGLGIFLLEFLLQGWLRSFSNTYGHMIAQYSGVFKKEKLFINDGTPIVSQVYNDPSKLLGEITSENCDAVMKANVGISRKPITGLKPLPVKIVNVNNKKITTYC